MQFRIDGIPCELEQGQTILDAVRTLGLDSDSPARRPLAVRLGGEVFNLNYTPFREADMQLLRYCDEEGRRVYERTLQFVLIMCVRKLFPTARVVVCYSLGSGLCIRIENEPVFSPDDMERLREEMAHAVKADHPLERRRMSISDALSFFEADGQTDKAELLKWRRFSYFDVYRCPGYSSYMDYFYGEMAPSTGYVSVFDLHYLSGGAFVMLMPDLNRPDTPAIYEDSPKMAEVYARSDRWGCLMTCSTANELNARVENGSVRELIRVNEALHEKMFARVADEIISHRARAVMLAGPSSSGKTTSANRIATQLRAEGFDPIMISLDDYYIDRDKCPRDEHGEMDLEHINTLDIERFNHDLRLLLEGEEVELPIFNFMTGRREPTGKLLRCTEEQPLIIEGIHGLNPLMIGEGIDRERVYRVYVSALATINLDDHNRVRTTDMRLLRRLVRDYENRGASMERTLSMWASVRRGESRWIFPFQEQADMVLNTTLHYEPCIMKRHVYPLLLTVPPESEYYGMARAIVKYLNYFLEADVEDEIPPTSILREFIGGNTFYR